MPAENIYPDYRPGRMLLPAAVGLLAIATVLLFAWIEAGEHKKDRLNEARAVTEGLAHSLGLDLNGDREFLVAGADRLATQGYDHEGFVRMFGGYAEGHPGMVGISHVDGTFTIRDITPPSPRMNVEGVRITWAGHADVAALAASTGVPRFTGPVQILRGEPGFLLYAPMYGDGGNFIGLLTGVYSLNAMLRDGVPGSVSERYWVEIVDVDGGELAALDERKPIDTAVSYMAAIDPPGGIAIRLTAYESGELEYMGIYALAISALLTGILVWGWVTRSRLITRLEAAQGDLERMGRRYLGLFEGSPVGIVVDDFSGVAALRDRLRSEGVRDMRGYLESHPEEVEKAARSVRRLDANRAALDIFGVADKEALLSTDGIDTHFTDKTRHDFMELVAGLMEGGRDLFSETEVVRPDGAVVFADINSVTAEGHGKDLSYVITSITDVSERVSVQRELQAAIKRYQGIFEGSPVAITVNDFSAVARLRDKLLSQGVHDFRAYVKEHPEEFSEALRHITRKDANRNAVELYRAPGKEYLLSPEGIGKHFTKKTAADLTESVLSFMEGETVTECETELVDYEGNLLQVHLKGTVVPGSESDLGFVLTGIVDITERKKAETALRESERTLKAIMDNIPARAWLKSADGRILDANEAYFEGCGLTRDEAVGRYDHEIWPEETAKHFVESDEAVRASGERTVFMEHIVDDDGTERWFETVKTPIFDDQGVFAGTAGLAHEVTDAVLIEKQKSELHSMISHDIRTPITLIKGNIEMLGKKYEDDRTVMSVAGAVMRSADKITAMFEDYVALTRLESADMVLRTLPADICAIVEGVCAEFDEPAKKKTVGLGFVSDPGLPKAVVDAAYVQRAVTNLVQNAVNYTPSGGAVTVSLRAEPAGSPDSVVIEVADTGPGIPVYERRKVFDRYYRIRASSQKIKGSGLGLSIVRAVAEAHGGSVTVDANPGGGSIFRLRLPLKPLYNAEKVPE